MYRSSMAIVRITLIRSANHKLQLMRRIVDVMVQGHKMSSNICLPIPELLICFKCATASIQVREAEHRVSQTRLFRQSPRER